MQRLRLLSMAAVISLSAPLAMLDGHLYQFAEAQAAWELEEFGDRSPNNSCFARTTELLSRKEITGADLKALPGYCSTVWAHHLYVIWYS